MLGSFQDPAYDLALEAHLLLKAPVTLRKF